MPDKQVVVLLDDLKKKAGKSDNPVLEEVMGLLRAAAVNGKTLPYLAAFGFGSLVGWDNEKTIQGSMRVGLEALIFTHLATTEDNQAAAIFGVAGLSAIGLSLTVKGIIERYTGEERQKAIDDARIVAEAPPEDKPFYNDWVMMSMTGSWPMGPNGALQYGIGYCAWMALVHPEVQANVCSL